MNENLFLIIYPLFYVFPYFFTKINRYLGLFASLAFLLFLLSLSKNALDAPAALALIAWSALSSFYVISRSFKKERNDPRSERLREIKEAKEREKKEFFNLKKQTEKIAETEKKLSLIYSVTKILSESLNIKSASASVSRYICDYFGTDKLSFYLYDPFEKKGFELFCGERRDADAEKLKALPPERDGFLENGKLHLVLREEEGIFCLLLLPCAGDEEKETAEAAVSFLSDIYPGLKRIQLFNRIEMLSQTDGLTGLFRRGFFDNKIKEEFKRAGIFKTSLGLMIIDLDHFKRVNDTYGHQAGDAVLKQTASILKESVYETDFVARYGGEEFAIILPRADSAGALRKAEYIRERIEKESFNIGFENIKITISAGLAHYPRDSRTPEDLIAMADKALYRAKKDGRNRVVDIKD